jgi:hypothetical protein
MADYEWKGNDLRWVALAILIGGALFAASLLFVFRFEIAVSPGQIPLARLDRWTGAVTVCTRAQRPAPTDPFNVGAALDAGYSPTEIVNSLTAGGVTGLKAERTAGLSDSEITARLVAQSALRHAQPKESGLANFLDVTGNSAAPHLAGAIPMDCDSSH